MYKKVFYDDDARRRVLAGAELVYNAVKTTMGPKGRNVLISRQFGPPVTTHDGVTVARSIEFQDKDDETLGMGVGVNLVKGAADKMDDVGDGTTTITVLAYHMLLEGHRLMAAGHNPILLKKGIEIAAAKIEKGLDEISEPVETKEKTVEIATISAGDAELGKLIADVVHTVGKDGVVTVEESQGLIVESEIVEGFTFDRGYVSPYFVTDQSKQQAVYEKVSIVLIDQTVANIHELLPLIEKLANSGSKQVLFVADDIIGEALGALALNKLKGTFNSVAVRAPSFGDRRKDIMNDLAAFTGATLITADRGMKLSEVDLDVVGFARKVMVTKDSTTIIEGNGSEQAISDIVEQIAKQIDEAPSEYDKEQLQNRAASLSGRVAIIKVGGATQPEIEEKKFRVDDAVAAVKAALKEGIVPGGGVTLLQLGSRVSTKHSNLSVSAGIGLLKRTVQMPFLTLMENSGINAHEWLPLIMAEGSLMGMGVDVNDPVKLIDLKKAGIIDPTKVTKEALRSAVSIAGTAMTMGALVVDIPVEQSTAQPVMPPM